MSGRTPSVLNPMSRTMESAVTAITVPSRPWPPASFFREWLCSYSEKMSLNDSTGSLAGAVSAVEEWVAFASGVPGLEVSGLDMDEVKAPGSVIPIRITPRCHPDAGRRPQNVGCKLFFISESSFLNRAFAATSANGRLSTEEAAICPRYCPQYSSDTAIP